MGNADAGADANADAVADAGANGRSDARAVAGADRLTITAWLTNHWTCGCQSCSCPRFGWRRVCINLGPWCVPFGSGKVAFSLSLALLATSRLCSAAVDAERGCCM